MADNLVHAANPQEFDDVGDSDNNEQGQRGTSSSEEVLPLYLFLWLDCDREGENICLEVLRVLRSRGLFVGDDAEGAASASSSSNSRVYRAKFSALAERDIKNAWARPGRIDMAKALAVDVRQELDLKIGCAFTRFLTREILNTCKARFEDPTLRVISFGPCQTPTLFFCVKRAQEIAAFKRRPFWEVHATGTWGRTRKNDEKSSG